MTDNDVVVSFETSKLARELNFDWDVDAYYNNYRIVSEFSYYELDRNITTYTDFPAGLLYMAPTQSLLQKWLREKHGIDVFVNAEFIGSDDREYYWTISHEAWAAKRLCNRIETISSVIWYPGGYKNVLCGDDYEETLELGLKEALVILKQKLIRNET